MNCSVEIVVDNAQLAKMFNDAVENYKIRLFLDKKDEYKFRLLKEDVAKLRNFLSRCVQVEYADCSYSDDQPLPRFKLEFKGASVLDAFKDIKRLTNEKSYKKPFFPPLESLSFRDPNDVLYIVENGQLTQNPAA